MNGPVPASAVRFWVSYPGEHEKTCDQKKWTPAFALATVYTTINEVNAHEIHYHLTEDDERGFVLREYLRDERAKAGERPLGQDEPIHFHGLYVDLEPAKELILAVKSHQHGAE